MMNPILKYLSGDTRRLGIISETSTDQNLIPEDLEIFFDVPYNGKDGNPLHADICRPKNKKVLPVIIMIHGGGLFLGETRSSKPFAQLYARHGYVTTVISYRFLQECDGIAIISDILTGFDFIKEHISEYGGDPERIFVTGESAGAFLAIMANAVSHSAKLAETLVLKASPLKIKAMAFFSGMIYTNRLDPLGLMYRKDLYGAKNAVKGFRKLIDPEGKEILDHLPPLILSSSDGDFLKKYTLDYVKALTDQGKNPLLLYYPQKDLLHAFPITTPSRKECWEVHEKVLEFFDQYAC